MIARSKKLRSVSRSVGVIKLSLAGQERFAHAILSPAKPGPTLKRAFARRRKLIVAD